MAPAKCSFIKEDKFSNNMEQCGCMALKGRTMCRHHEKHEPESGEVYGKMDDRGASEDHNNPEFFKDYSLEEIYNYVYNGTGGRIEVDMSRGHEHAVQTAIEAL